jgi:CRISPR type III-A-associated protein Csm2
MMPSPHRVVDDPTNRNVKAFLDAVNRTSKLSGVDVTLLINAANDLGRDLKPIRASQLRHVLDAVVRLRARWRQPGANAAALTRATQLLKPRLAYQAARQNERPQGPQPFHTFAEMVSVMVDRVQEQADFEEVAEFVQAVVAYHRFYGGQD